MRSRVEYQVLDVESHSLKVEQHLKRVAEGVYRLPEFQRTFVWDDERVLKLWDSLYHGFPIGQLMLWEPSEGEFPMRSLGRRQVEAESKKRGTAIIDGQQRLTALYLVLSGDVGLRFDLAEERFVFGDGANRLRLDILADLGAGAPSFSEVAGSQFFFLRATDAQRASSARAINYLNGVLTQRELPSQVIKDADYATVLGVFKRLNQQGEPLTLSQLTMAGISQHWPGVFKRTHDLLKRMNVEMGFDQADDPEFVFQVWTAVHTGQHLGRQLAPKDARSKYASRATREHYEVSWSETERGISRLIEMMRRELDLTNFRFIKAYYPLAVSAHYLATHPSPSAEEMQALMRWLVLSLVTGRYHDRAISKYAGDIKATGRGRSLAELFKHRSALDPASAEAAHLGVDRLLTAGSRSAYATLLYLVARKMGAKDWHDPRISVGDELGEGAWRFHHVFPYARFEGERARLEEALEDAREDGDEEKMDRVERHVASLDAKIASLGNLAFVTPETSQRIGERAPADYLKEIAETAAGRAALEAQLIPLDPALWKHAAFDTFCRRRCEALAARAKELFFAPIIARA
jgi:hypothetical protein